MRTVSNGRLQRIRTVSRRTWRIGGSSGGSGAQWALDLTLDERPGVAATGFNMLTALSQSEWAGVHEDAWITAVTDDVLNNLGGPPVGPTTTPIAVPWTPTVAGRG